MSKPHELWVDLDGRFTTFEREGAKHLREVLPGTVTISREQLKFVVNYAWEHDVFYDDRRDSIIATLEDMIFDRPIQNPDAESGEK